MAAAFPGSSNVYVPNHESSGNLIVGYSRNPKKFAINRYCKIVPVTKDVGKYLNITAEEAARIINTDLADFSWRDGAEAPAGNDNLESFEFLEYRTERYIFPFNLGHKTVNHADWPIISIHAGFAAQKAMTARTVAAQTVMTTAANWSGNTDSATNKGGGAWDASSATNKYIRRSIDAIKLAIHEATLGTVNPDQDLHCVISPNLAIQSAETEEFRDMLKNSPFALAEVRGDVENQNGTWGLPSKLYGMPLEIEDAVKVTSKKGATKVTAKVQALGDAFFLSRPGGLQGMEGIPEFTTLQIFMLEEFTVETMDDKNNRRTVGRVVEDYGVELAAPASGYYLTGCAT